MPYKEKPKPFVSYSNAMHRSNTRLFCPDCNISMLPKRFENHCLVHHNIDSKTHCVWCRRMSWPAGEKLKNGKHLTACFKDFMKAFRYKEKRKSVSTQTDSINNIIMNNSKLNVIPPNNTNSENSNSTAKDLYHLLDMTHEFPEKDFFGHQMTHPNPMFGETLEEFLNIPASPLPAEILPPLPVPFADDNLNLAASCVLFYLENKDTHDFFHVMVRLPVYESFLEAMEQDQENSYMLPFSCWCDGGKYPEPHYRQHRHAIIVSPKNHFRENVWPEIKLAQGTRPPKPKYPCKTLKVISSPRYLVNTIGYLSRRKSRCNFSFKKNTKRLRDNHFYLYRTLPKEFKLHLFLLWENGVLELLKQTKFQNVSVARLAQDVLFRDPESGKWTQKIKDFYKLDRGLVAHVARDYVPTNEITPHFLHLEKDGRKLYFHKSPENRNLDDATWLRKQIEGGNCFYEAVQECTWAPRPRDQKILNFHKPTVDRNRELESRVARVEEQLEETNREKEEMRREMKNLTNQIIQYKDEEIIRLKYENERQKREIERLNRENDKLKQNHTITF